MTERGRSAISRSEHAFQVGPSALCWREDGTLVITLDEIAAPIPRRVRGTIRVAPAIMPQTAFALDAAALHIWQPIAPVARVCVELERPALVWNGSAYLDSNRGDEPLEDGFRSWTWSRAHTAAGCVVFYDSIARDGEARSMALGCGDDGAITALDPPPERALPGTLWRVARTSRADAGAACDVERTLEDTPFYARSLLRTTVYGERVQSFHESLSLDRFRSPVVKAMLPFRMPRRSGGAGRLKEKL